MYSRYNMGHGRYQRVRPDAAPENDRSAKGGRRSCSQKPRESAPSGLSGLLGGILPAGIDIGDILLLLVLLFLYTETKDEDFLIILIIMAFSILS